MQAFEAGAALCFSARRRFRFAKLKYPEATRNKGNTSAETHA